MAQYVFTMNRLGKIVPPKRHILKDISLSFFPGAKIGVLGTNGSGKSTLLKIMAGIDKEIEGEAIPMAGLNIGYLPQDIELFSGSIADNIARLGEVDPLLVVQAAQLVEMHEVILSFPKGYDTPIGEAGGLRLSHALRRRLRGTEARAQNMHKRVDDVLAAVSELRGFVSKALRR